VCFFEGEMSVCDLDGLWVRGLYSGMGNEGRGVGWFEALD
jgi:hypothetical protein